MRGEQCVLCCVPYITRSSGFSVRSVRNLFVLCVETELHAKHTHLSVKEEAQWRKRELMALLYNLPEKLELDIKQARASRERAAQYIKTQAQTIAGQIKSEFAKLHQFLRAEEEARLAALKQEESKKTGLLTERINRLTSDVTSLSERISDVQYRMLNR
ncbi:tripartite motif-containing protein 35-like [Salmo trutta]|uniref:tripartite motif-containing protein 35-like n=1 Tax=Salmo trutta TaxID=8032 RepID=UPI0011304C7A|nr:tripartite motif-containing protein 35-like [Salmo trutta]